MMASIKVLIRSHWPLLCILIVAAFFRLFHLGQLPIGFHNDEVSAGYVGRYLFLHRGVDITGHRFPLYYDTFGDFRPIAIYILSGASTFLLGVNTFAVRFLPSVLGILTIIPLYLFCVRLFHNRSIALFSCLFLALSPWHIVLSRATSEGVVGLFFLLTGLVYLLKYIEEYSLKAAILACISFSITYLTYHAFRVLTPLVIVPFYFYPKLQLKGRQTILALTSILFCVSIAFFITKSGTGRLNQVFITQSPQVTNTIAEFTQGEGPGHTILARIFHNKPVVYVRKFLGMYADYFSPSFLFSRGGFPDRYVVPDAGLFPWIFVVFLACGVCILITKRTFSHAYLLWLIAVTPLPAALTIDDVPNVHRAICLLIPLIITSAIGAVMILDNVDKRRILLRTVIAVFSVVLLLETIYFWHQYAAHEQAHKSYYRNDMVREMVQKAANMRALYDIVYMPQFNSIPLYYLFFTNNFSIPPGLFSYGGIITHIDNIQFVDNWCPTHVKSLQSGGKKVLYVNKGDCLEDGGYRILEIMNQHDGARAFQFLEENRVAGTPGNLVQ